MRIVLLTDAPGAGKTTVLTALMNLLEADDRQYAAIEMEALALVHPLPDDDAAFSHIEFVAESFRDRGYPRLLVSATIEDNEFLRRRASIERRPLRPPRCAALAESLAALPGFDLALSTVDADPNVLAAKIRDAM